MNEFVYTLIVDQSLSMEQPRMAQINFKGWVEKQHNTVRRIIYKGEIESFEEFASKAEDDLLYLGHVGELSMERLREALWKFGIFLRDEDENFLRMKYPRFKDWPKE